MVFFLVVPAWILCRNRPLVLFFFRQSRSLSLYLVLASTSGTVVSFILSTGWLWLGPKLFGNMRSWARWVFIALYLASIAFGGLIGVVAGLVPARKTNQWLRWT